MFFSFYVAAFEIRMDAVDNPKFQKLLFQLLDSEFKVQNDTYFNNLLEHIKDSQGMLLQFNIYIITCYILFFLYILHIPHSSV